ncbi:hypothetical protein KKG48_00490 [Patescibacteria group bacterium]|nr:hypothetical protein [Patescibacteria group bacterium]MCG2694974.1 hypothetical protein [Candidatus Parcubacteria bacterium]
MKIYIVTLAQLDKKRLSFLSGFERSEKIAVVSRLGEQAIGGRAIVFKNITTILSPS